MTEDPGETRGSRRPEAAEPQWTSQPAVGAGGVADRLAAVVREFADIDLPVRIRAWDGTEAGPADGPVMVLKSRRALRRLVWAPGELGLARGYVCGDIDIDGDLGEGLTQVWKQAGSKGRRAPTAGGAVKTLLLMARLGALGLPPRPPYAEARPRGRLHSRGRDRAVIAHHYDLSNAFYQLLLDERMVYSSAYFTSTTQTLHDAQTTKLDLICTKLGLRQGMQLLDVGCGWGALILHAAREYGVTATGITLSEQQAEFIAQRVAALGLDGRVSVQLRDYRDLPGLPQFRSGFDAVASVEMGEHVGEDHYPRYADTLYAGLRPGGLLLLQQMSRRTGAAPGGGPFIESYIAPDMHMRPLPRTLEHLETAGFEIRHVETLREHYARTVECWIGTFEDRYDEFVALLGEQVARVWRLYLVGGRLAFEAGRMGVDQVLAAKTSAGRTLGVVSSVSPGRPPLRS
jgi:cyclopropane-fatty-acyl-phospholipid synthase